VQITLDWLSDKRKVEISPILFCSISNVAAKKTKEMSLIEVLKARLEERFENAKPIGAHVLAPRNGYFFIEGVDYAKTEKKGKFPVAKVLWQPNSSDFFIKDVPFNISLSSLKLSSPFDYMVLTNQIIKFSNVKVVRIDGEGKPQITCEYLLSDHKPVFLTIQDLVTTAVMGNFLTLPEAYQNFESKLGVNLSDSLEEEAQRPDNTEDPLDDYPCED
jgi:hypothetical protein